LKPGFIPHGSPVVWPLPVRELFPKDLKKNLPPTPPLGGYSKMPDIEIRREQRLYEILERVFELEIGGLWYGWR